MCVHLYLYVDDDECSRIVHVSIIVLGIYTCGISLLLWWLWTKLSTCFPDTVKDDPKGKYISLLTCINIIRMCMSAYILCIPM